MLHASTYIARIVEEQQGPKKEKAWMIVDSNDNNENK